MSLPESLLERLANVSSVRAFTAGNSPRTDVRIPVSLRAEAMPLERDCLGEIASARVRDVSRSGVGLMLPAKVRLRHRLVVGICPRGFETHWLAVRVRRAAIADGICLVIGGSWEKLLYPGQVVQPGVAASSLLWMDLEDKDRIFDPFIEDAPDADNRSAGPQARR